MMGAPPSEAGALHDTVACASPATATMFVGAPGGLAGTTALEGADATPEPRALLADTVKV